MPRSSTECSIVNRCPGVFGCPSGYQRHTTRSAFRTQKMCSPNSHSEGQVSRSSSSSSKVMTKSSPSASGGSGDVDVVQGPAEPVPVCSQGPSLHNCDHRLYTACGSNGGRFHLARMPLGGRCHRSVRALRSAPLRRRRLHLRTRTASGGEGRVPDDQNDRVSRSPNPSETGTSVFGVDAHGRAGRGGSGSRVSTQSGSTFALRTCRVPDGRCAGQ